jgi:hypothetical protein
MTESAPRSSKWRIRWAEHQNARRGQDYVAAIDAWRRQDADLRAMRHAAASFTGVRDSGSLSVPLRRDERIYLTLAGVQAVEAPHAAGLPAVTTTIPPVTATAGPVPAGIRVRDNGQVLVTSRRLVFLGPRNNREWSYDRLTGLIHDPTAPMTLMRVSNRKAVSGVLIDPPAAASFRFNLQLAIADAAGDRAGLVAYLDHLIGDHDHVRPAPPTAAEPAQAPIRAAWSPLRIVGAGAAVFVLLMCVIAVLLPDPAVTPVPPSDIAAGTTTTTPAGPELVTQPTPKPPSPSSTTSTATASAEAPTAAAPKPTTVRPRAKLKPTSKPAPKPKPVNLCGAPKNPLGYNFCGGSQIRTPDFDACTYFDCIDAFWDGKGYMIQCDDGMVSMSGGRQGSCSHHGGNRRTVYRR